MLVLSRKSGENIQISDDITVTVLECRGKRVRLGINAPEGVDIFRGEIAERREQWQNRLSETATKLELTLA